MIFTSSHFDFKLENQILFGFTFLLYFQFGLKKEKKTVLFICFFSMFLKQNNQTMTNTQIMKCFFMCILRKKPQKKTCQHSLVDKLCIEDKFTKIVESIR